MFKQKNEIMKKIEHDVKLCHWKKLPSSNKHIGKEWCYQALHTEQK